MKKIFTTMVMAFMVTGSALAQQITRDHAASTAIINPNGQSNIQGDGKHGPIPGMTTIYPSVYMATVPRPAHIDDADSRLTFAVDICMVGGYEQDPPNGQHIVVASRVNPNDPTNENGNNAWGGTVLGSLWGTGKVYSEERGVNPRQNLFWGANGATLHIDPSTPGANDGVNGNDGVGNNAVVSHQWYRIVTDTIRLNGGRKLESRVYRITDELNNVIEGTPLHAGGVWSPYHAAYPLGYDNVMLVHAATGNSIPASNFIVGRIAAYWSKGGQWIVNP